MGGFPNITNGRVSFDFVGPSLEGPARAVKDSKTSAYPFPAGKLPTAEAVISQKFGRALDAYRKENAPDAIKALGKQAVMRETARGNVKELNMQTRPPTSKAGNNSSF